MTDRHHAASWYDVADDVAFAPGGGAPDYRAPPHNIEAEQAVLGAILMRNSAIEAVSPFLMADHFYDPLHGRIYEACRTIINAGRMASPVSLKGFFDHDEAMAALGGPAYLARLAAAATSLVSAGEYARTVFDLSVRRGLIDIAADLHNRAYDAPVGKTPVEMAEEAENAIGDLITRGSIVETISTIGQAARRAVDLAAEAYRSGKPAGLSTGLPSVDEIVGPLTPGAVIVIGGATSMGKTALADQICAWNAGEGKVVVEFSLEMMAAELATRQLAALARIPAWRVEAGRFNDAEFDAISRARDDLQARPLYIEDKRGLTVAQMRSRARLIKRRHGLDLVMIDHLQFIRAEDPRAAPHNRLEQITSDIKAMAGDLGVPVLLVSHLSRETQRRDGNRPQLSDLHGSSAIEKDADIVAFVHRPEYYLERNRPEENTPEWLAWLDQIARWKGLAEIIVGKRRKGTGSGARRLAFNAQFTEFSEIPAGSAPPARGGRNQEALAP